MNTPNEEPRKYFLYDGVGPERLAYRDGHNLLRVLSPGGQWNVCYDHKFMHLSTALSRDEFHTELIKRGCGDHYELIATQASDLATALANAPLK